MEPHKPDLKTVFNEALERPAGPDRLAYLDEACRDDPALRAEVEELLGAHDRAGGFLGSSAGTATFAPAGEPGLGPTADATGPAPAASTHPTPTDGDATDATHPPDPSPSPAV